MENPVLWIAFVIAAAVLLVIVIYLLFKLKNKNNSLKSLKTLLNSYAENDRKGISFKDASLKYIFVNAEYARLFGKKESDFVGLTDFDIFERHIVDFIQETDERVLKSGSNVTYERTINSCVFRVIKFQVKLADGTTGVGCFIQDTTEEKRFLKNQERIFNRNKTLLDFFSQSFPSRESQLDYIVDAAKRVSESREGFVFFSNKDAQPDHIACIFCLKALETKKPVIINDFNTKAYETVLPAEHRSISCVMIVPVVIRDKAEAVIGLANKPGGYSDEDASEIDLLISGMRNAVVRREAEEKLAFERDRFLKTLVSIGSGVIATDKNGIIEIQNTAAEKLTGRSHAEAVGRPYSEVYTVERAPGQPDPIGAALSSGRPFSSKTSVVLISKNGTRYHIEENAAPIRDSTGTAGAVLIFSDVTEMEVQRGKIEFLSFHDPLTGLYNRRFFEEEMRRLDVKRNLPLSIIMGDANGLKLTNDIFGHAFGDTLIKKAAQTFKKVCRSDDIIARLDGDEFVILLPRTDAKGAESVIERIKEEFSKEQVKMIRCNISMGTDTKTEMSENLLDVYKNAEEKMYHAKVLESDSFNASAIELFMATLQGSTSGEKKHSDFVSELCARIGAELGLSDTVRKKLYDAGYYHDIGKITLDRKLLKKHFNLTDQEWNEIRKHPLTGYRILSHCSSTMDLADAVLAHHERWDGYGYPKGLKGDEIPLMSRIIAIAEGFERKLSGDDFNPPLSLADAQKYITQNAGTLYDPSLIGAFLKVSSQYFSSKN